MKKFNLTRLIIIPALAAGLIITCGREGPIAPDVDPPVVSSTSPYYQEQNVPINTSIKITFNETIDGTSLNNESLQVRLGDAVVSGAVSCNGSAATFKPSANLSANTTYYVTVGVGAKDLAGNVMTGPYVFSFTTGASAGNPVETHTITAKVSGVGGSISPGSATVDHGGTASFTVTPDSNYHIESVSGCNGTLSGSTYVTGAVTANCTVTASFTSNAPATHTVSTIVDTPGGRVDPSGVISVEDGKSITYHIDASRGYRIVPPAEGCGGTLGDYDDEDDRHASYTTAPIVGDCTVQFSFRRIESTVTPLTVGPGRLIPDTFQHVYYEEKTSFTVVPDDPLFTMATVTGCNGSLSPMDNLYTTGPIIADCEVLATFATGSTPAVTPSPGTIGKIIPAGPQLVEYNSVITFASVTGCNESPAGSLCPIGPLCAHCAVTAGFAGGSSLTVTPSSGTNGEIIPAGPQYVAYNGIVTFIVIPAEGYSIASVTGCDGVLAENIYTTGHVMADCTVTAVFNQNIAI